MTEVKLNKIFKDENFKDIYVLSIKTDDGRYYNLNLTKEQFESVFFGIRNIYDNIKY